MIDTLVKFVTARVNVMKTPICTARTAEVPVVDRNRHLTDGSPRHRELINLVRTPWMLRVRTESLIIMPATPRDLEAVSAMHARCSPASLLDRYQLGGRKPSVLSVQRMLRRPLSFVAARADGSVIAWAVASVDRAHGDDRAEVGVIVQDDWQAQGIGAELTAHLAGAALVCGYVELIAYPGTNAVAALRTLIEIGHCRVVMSADNPHLHTFLPESATLGLGAVREGLAS